MVNCAKKQLKIQQIFNYFILKILMLSIGRNGRGNRRIVTRVSLWFELTLLDIIIFGLYKIVAKV
jgi:hypothetical protein